MSIELVSKLIMVQIHVSLSMLLVIYIDVVFVFINLYFPPKTFVKE